MDLVEVNRLDSEPAQGVLALALDRGRFELVDAAAVLAFEPAFREDEGFLGHLRKRPSDHLFGAAKAVDGCGVDPVDDQLECPLNGRYRVGVVLRAPAPLPATAAYCPGAEADDADLHSRCAQGARLHLLFPSRDRIVVSD